MNPMDWGYIVMCQADVENTQECLLPVCNKSYHALKEN